MWAELYITNTSQSQNIRDVEVRVAKLIYVGVIQNSYELVDLEDWNPTCVYWSERNAQQSQLKLNIPPSATRVSLIAFTDDSNGGSAVFNAPISPKPWFPGGAKIEVEVTSLDSALWKGYFYIECHPNYLGGPRATFEFVEWETWETSHNVTYLSGLDKEDY